VTDAQQARFPTKLDTTIRGVLSAIETGFPELTLELDNHAPLKDV
jgi:hypothetical protein